MQTQTTIEPVQVAHLPSAAGYRGHRKTLNLNIQIVLFLFTLLLLFSRRPSDLLYAQFYAEDGARWYADAYNLGSLHTLFLPWAGYLQVLPRLSGSLALLVPFRFAPLLMNLIGGVIQALPVSALLSRRCSPWGSLPARAAMAALYLANPNAQEIHVNITNAQWHLALLLVLLAFALPAETWRQKTADVLLFLLGAFSGPFVLVLCPLLLLFWWQRRASWSLVLTACLGLGVIAQVPSLLTGIRLSEPLGATLALLTRIVGADVILNSVAGSSQLGHAPALIPALGLIFGLAVILAGVFLGPLGFRLFALYALAWFIASLHSPVILPAPRWLALLNGPGMRYYFFPSLLFLWSAVYCVSRARIPILRFAGYATLSMFLLGAARKWEYLPFPDHHLSQSAARLQAAHPGETVVIPIFPDPWHMDLIKRRSNQPHATVWDATQKFPHPAKSKRPLSVFIPLSSL